MSNLKVEGKVGDFCLNCKNCKAVTRLHDGKNASIRLTEVECEDPYDAMVKTLNVDSDICCSMFEPNSPCDKISLLQHELEMDRLTRTIHQLEKEKAAHLKGIERLKKTQEKLKNQVKNLQTTNEESYKREEKMEEKFKEANKLADSWKRDYEFVRDQLIHPIYDILYPDNPNRDINVTDLLNDVKNLKIYEDENKSMYEDLKYWRERCHGAETDVTTLNSKVETLKDKYEAAMTGWKDAIDANDKMIGEKDKQIEELTRRYNMIAKKLNDVHDILKEDETNERYH